MRSHSGSSTATKAPTKGPKKLPAPPTITINSRLNDRPSAKEFGSMNCTSGAYSAPDNPPRLEPMAKAISVYRRVSRPSESARSGFSRKATKARPHGERSIHQVASESGARRQRQKKEKSRAPLVLQPNIDGRGVPVIP